MKLMQHLTLPNFKRLTFCSISSRHRPINVCQVLPSIIRYRFSRINSLDLTYPNCISIDLPRSRSCSKSTLSSRNYTNKFIMVRPRLVVFDLDYTLWPFWVDTHVDPPFTMASNGKVYDAHQQHVTHYKDVPAILKRLYEEGIYLGIASRTSLPVAASDLTRLFNWDQYFHYRQIYPGCKITHFKKLHGQSGIKYEDMIFFDDEHRNIHDVSSLGVTCILVPDGVNNDSFERGMQVFKERKASKAQPSKS